MFSDLSSQVRRVRRRSNSAARTAVASTDWRGPTGPFDFGKRCCQKQERLCHARNIWCEDGYDFTCDPRAGGIFGCEAECSECGSSIPTTQGEL